MKIQPITHKTLAETVAGKLAASLLDGSLVPGTQLPSRRELMNQLGVSRATLREALKALEESRLIEARPNVGWFVHAVDESNVTKASELAACSGCSTPALRRERTAHRSAACAGRPRKAAAHPQPAHRPPGNLRVHLLVGAGEGPECPGAGGRSRRAGQRGDQEPGADGRRVHLHR